MVWHNWLSLNVYCFPFWKSGLLYYSLSFRRNNSLSASSANSADAPWICGKLTRYTAVDRGWKTPIFTAGVVFRYPTVGRVIFRQPRDQPWTDTTIIVETLVHGDGTSVNNTANHRWAVHVEPRGKDYYNWTGRCLSAGPIYNPYKVINSWQNSFRLEIFETLLIVLCMMKSCVLIGAF